MLNEQNGGSTLPLKKIVAKVLSFFFCAIKYYCRPPLEAHFHAACFAKCHNPIGPRVASWLVVKESGSGIEKQWKRDTCYGILEAVSASWEERMREGFCRESEGSVSVTGSGS